MQRSALQTGIIVTLVLLLGLSAGYWLGKAPTDQPQNPDSTSARPSTDQDSLAGSKGINTSSHDTVNFLLKTTFYNQGGSVTTNGYGLLVNNGEKLVVPLTDLEGASSGNIMVENHKVTVNTVTGIIANIGLAILNTPLRHTNSFNVSNEISLYRGLSVEVVTANQRFNGEITSNAQSGLGPLDRYQLRIGGPQPIGNYAALVLPNTNNVVGIVIKDKLSNTMDWAIDAYHLNAIAYPLPTRDSALLSEFSNSFFSESQTGKILKINEAARNLDWQYIIDQGSELLQSLSNSAELIEIISIAYLQLAADATNNGSFDKAIEFMDAAELLLGSDARFNMTRANAYYKENKYSDALQTLYAAMDYGIANDQVYALANNILRNAIQSKQLQDFEKVTLLEQAITRDSLQAVYHAELGKLQYTSHNYQQAITHLSEAIRLQPEFYAALNPLISNARTRLNSPDHIVVPLIRKGNMFYVNAVINGVNKELLLDTGASITAISRDLVDELSITNMAAIKTIELSTANGIVSAPVIELQSLQIGSAMVTHTPAALLENLGQNGVIGLSFLNNFNIDINQASNELILSK